MRVMSQALAVGLGPPWAMGHGRGLERRARWAGCALVCMDDSLAWGPLACLGNGASRPEGCWSDFDLRTDMQAMTWLKTNRHLNKVFVGRLDSDRGLALRRDAPARLAEPGGPAGASRRRGWARARGVDGGPC